MLLKLIHLLSKENLYLESTLASQLGVGKEMARQLLRELVRLGYVENTVPAFPSGCCNDCTSQCRSPKCPENRTAIWMLTEKGRQAAVGIPHKGD